MAVTVISLYTGNNGLSVDTVLGDLEVAKIEVQKIFAEDWYAGQAPALEFTPFGKFQLQTEHRYQGYHFEAILTEVPE